MDQTVKTTAVLTVQIQRDVTLKLEHVLMDARLGGDSRHVIHVRHIPSLKKISIDYLYLLIICVVFSNMLIKVCTKLWLKSNAILIVTFLNRTYFIKLFWIVNQIKWNFDALLWSFPNNSKHNLIRLCMSILTYWKILWMISLYQILRTNTVAKN